VGGAFTAYGSGGTVRAATGDFLPGSTSADSGAINAAVPPSPIYIVWFDVNIGPSSSALNYPNFLFRAQSLSNPTTFYQAYYDAGTPGWHIAKKVSGSFSELGQYAGLMAANTVYTVGLGAVDANTIGFFTNGSSTPVATFADHDAALAAAGYAGFSAHSPAVIDNFRASAAGATSSQLAASPGSFAITGGPATFTFTQVASPAAFAIAGRPAAFQQSLLASTSAFALSGSPVAFGIGLAGAPGNYVISGQSLAVSIGLAAASGSFALAGGAASFVTGLAALLGSFAVAGQPAAFTISASSNLAASPGAFVITGGPAKFSMSLSANVGAFAVTGQPAILTGGTTLFVMPATGLIRVARQIRNIVVPRQTSIIKVRRDGTMDVFPSKYPSASVIRGFDIATLLAVGEEIVSADVTAPGGDIQCSQVASDGSIVSFLMSGGTNAFQIQTIKLVAVTTRQPGIVVEARVTMLDEAR